MQTWQCDVIGCPELAAWARASQTDPALEDFLCNACWLRLAARFQVQAACYIVCNAGLAARIGRDACLCAQRQAVRRSNGHLVEPSRGGSRNE